MALVPALLEPTASGEGFRGVGFKNEQKGGRAEGREESRGAGTSMYQGPGVTEIHGGECVPEGGVCLLLVNSCMRMERMGPSCVLEGNSASDGGERIGTRGSASAVSETSTLKTRILSQQVWGGASPRFCVSRDSCEVCTADPRPHCEQREPRLTVPWAGPVPTGLGDISGQGRLLGPRRPDPHGPPLHFSLFLMGSSFLSWQLVLNSCCCVCVCVCVCVRARAID